MICDLPNKLIISVLFHLPVYFLTNLRRSASAFFTYWILSFVTVLVMSMVFRSIGSLSRTIEQTSAPSSTLIVLTIIYTGFVIPPSYMKPWLAWFRWVNPMAYTYESLMINEVRMTRSGSPNTTNGYSTMNASFLVHQLFPRAQGIRQQDRPAQPVRPWAQSQGS